MLSQTTLISDALTLPGTAIGYHVGERLQQLYPSCGLLHTSEGDFYLDTFVEAGHCRLALAADVYNHIDTTWAAAEQRLVLEAQHVWYEVEWRGHAIQTLVMLLPCGYRMRRFSWILAESQALAEAFFQAVCAWNAPVREEVLVFEDGYWSRSRELYLEIKSATLDNLILAGTQKEDIHRDLLTFLSSRPLYERYNIPWKRGMLFVGPAGNGKTHMVKALLNALDCPCLYVKSFSTEQGVSDQHTIRMVFEQARETTPCILVLEDLDSLVHDRNRSFFLNELDGFAGNAGIITLATTNHPERLDPAILDRPSRFDRKYQFPLPGLPERRRYLEHWNSSLQAEVRMAEAGLLEGAARTEGFSFAYLKELVVAALMAWVATAQPGAMDRIIVEQADLLRTQMASPGPSTTEEVQAALV